MPAPSLGLPHIEKSLESLFAGLDVLVQRELLAPALIVFYSILDSLASLARPDSAQYVTRADFLAFCDQYILRPGQEPVCDAIDLYAARCGVLHTNTPESKLSDDGKARVISYAWGTAAVADLREMIKRLGRDSTSVGLHLSDMVAALKVSAATFLSEVRADPLRLKLVESRAKMFAPLVSNRRESSWNAQTPKHRPNERLSRQGIFGLRAAAPHALIRLPCSLARALDRTRLHMPGTVYILGAGCSRAASADSRLPFPLATEFFDPARIKAHWSGWTLRAFEESSLARILTHYFGLRVRASRLAGVNVEEVYSFVDAFDQVYAARTYEPQILDAARRELISYIVDVVRYGQEFRTPLPRLVALTEVLEERDSILSFNWDTSIDRALATTPYGLELLKRVEYLAKPDALPPPLDPSEDALVRLHQGYFLKLHGAVNLTACVKRDCPNHGTPKVWPALEELPEHWFCEICGAPTRVQLLPPHVNKSYAGKRFFSLQASIAAQKLGMATSIVVIGYSFPRFDFEARTMMRCARIGPEDDASGSETFLSRLVVVNPQVRSRSYLRDVRELFGLTSPSAHGHKVELVLYPGLDEYLAAEVDPRRAASPRRHRKRVAPRSV